MDSIRNTLCLSPQKTFGFAKIHRAAILRILLFTLFFFTLELLDFFGISAATEAHSRRLVYQVLATKPLSHRDDITVVLLRDNDLKLWNVAWPVPYDFHAEILQSLYDFNAAMVFMDMAFIDERQGDSLEALNDVASQFDSGTLLAVDGGTKYTAKIRQGLDSKYFRLVAAPGEHQGIKYPLVQKIEYSDKSAEEKFSAALALYEEAGKITARGKPIFEYIAKRPFIRETFTSEMEVVWKIDGERATDGKTTGSANNLEVYTNKDCEIKEVGFFDRVVAAFLSGFSNQEKSALLSVCPYHTVVDASALLYGDERYRKLIENKIVLYGVDLTKLEDRIEPPTHHSLPAVHFHAMALNNLLDYKENYRKVDSKWKSPITFLCLLALMTVAEIFSIKIKDNRTSYLRKYNKKSFIEKSIYLFKFLEYLFFWQVFAALTVFIFCFISSLIFKLGVSNWVCLLFYIVIRSYDQFIEFIQELFFFIDRFWVNNFFYKLINSEKK